MVNRACCWGQHIFSSMANEQAKFQMFFAQRLKKTKVSPSKIQTTSYLIVFAITPFCKSLKLYLHLLDLGKDF